jgi:hypothetical protein
MRTLLKVSGAIVICVLLLLLILRLTGFEPRERTPGLWLKGDLVTTPVADWSYTDKYQTIKLQTRTWYLLPHSVTIWCIANDGQLYVASYWGGVRYPHGRHWTQNVARDPHVRLKIGDQLFDRTLLLVTDPTEKAAVLQARAKKYPKQSLPAGATFYVFHVMPD